MVFQKGLTVSLRNGTDGELMIEYDCEWRTKTRVSIEAVEGVIICPEITIHADFEWHGADGLLLAIRYGDEPCEILLWVPDQFKGKGPSERVNWSFQIPGKEEWDNTKAKSVHFVYGFCKAQVREEPVHSRDHAD